MLANLHPLRRRHILTTFQLARALGIRLQVVGHVHWIDPQKSICKIKTKTASSFLANLLPATISTLGVTQPGGYFHPAQLGLEIRSNVLVFSILSSSHFVYFTFCN